MVKGWWVVGGVKRGWVTIKTVAEISTRVKNRVKKSAQRLKTGLKHAYLLGKKCFLVG